MQQSELSRFCVNCRFNVDIIYTANGPLDEEFGDPAEQCSELSSSVHNPEPADNTHRGMKYCIHT